MIDVTVSQASFAEGDSGVTSVTFTATRTGPMDFSTYFDWRVNWGAGTISSGDLQAGSATSGRLSFAAWEVQKTFTISIAGDTLVEPDETLVIAFDQALFPSSMTQFSVSAVIADDDATAPTNPGTGGSGGGGTGGGGTDPGPGPVVGNESLSDLGGDDSIFGGAGADTISGEGGGSNYLRGGDGADVIRGGADFDDINGNVGDDTASGGRGGDWVVGGQGEDFLHGDDGDDIVYGNKGADTCFGDDGRDLLRGGQDNDSISGGAGDDWLSGDMGDDTLSGGSGADIFYGFGAAGLDQILDFNGAEGDRVQVDPGVSFSVAQSGADTVISISGGTKLVLVGVQASSLTGDWLFSG